MTVPAGFPLNTESRIMCLTCHSGHGEYLSAARAYPGQPAYASQDTGGSRFRTYYLRRSSPDDGFAALCRACHRKL
jgi:hypothetical protein